MSNSPRIPIVTFIKERSQSLRNSIGRPNGGLRVARHSLKDINYNLMFFLTMMLCYMTQKLNLFFKTKTQS
jgi:hypothetical protein